MLRSQSARACPPGPLANPRQRDRAGVTHAAKLTRAESRLDWNQDATTLDRRIRAFNPWPVAETQLTGETVKLLTSRVGDAGMAAPAPPGTVLGLKGDGLQVACGRGVLELAYGVERRSFDVPRPDAQGGVVAGLEGALDSRLVDGFRQRLDLRLSAGTAAGWLGSDFPFSRAEARLVYKAYLSPPQGATLEPSVLALPVAKLADGVVVGSALVRLIDESGGSPGLDEIVYERAVDLAAGTRRG